MAHPKYPCGTVWPAVGNEKELVSLEEALFDPSASPFGDHSPVGDLRCAMAKCGFTNLRSFRHAELSVRPKGFQLEQLDSSLAKLSYWKATSVQGQEHEFRAVALCPQGG